MPTNLEFLLPEERGSTLLSNQVLQHLYRHMQRYPWQSEAGGLLFSPEPELSKVEITHASGPNLRDVRSRYGFVPHLPSAIRDCRKHFEEGRHAVGLWHTHPEANPFPSSLDHETTQAYLSSCNGQLECFLLLIVGNRGKPPKVNAWLSGGKSIDSWHRLPVIE